MKIIRNTLWVLVAISLVVGIYLYTQNKQPKVITKVSELAFGQAFSLTDNKGNEITEQAFVGHPTLLFFGFTHCPEVCPTTLYEINAWLDALGDEASAVRSFFITVDPERDTPEVMNDYVTSMSDRVVGITGGVDEMEALVKSWRIYAKKIPEIGAVDGLGNYNMDHTASVLLVRPDGSLQGTITYGENTDVALDKIRLLLKNN